MTIGGVLRIIGRMPISARDTFLVRSFVLTLPRNQNQEATKDQIFVAETLANIA